MTRALVIALFAAASALADGVPDDVGEGAPLAQALAPGPSITRVIEWDADRDSYTFPVRPFVSNVIVVATGTIWDCEVTLMKPSGGAVIGYTNTAAGTAAQLLLKATTMATRVYLDVRGLVEFTTGTYTVGFTEQFTDADSDGLPDEWEIARFGLLTNASAGDADLDGFSNRDEWLAGTHPAQAASGLRITSLARPTNWTVVTWQAVPEGVYRVAQTTNALAGWTTDPTLIEATASTASNAVPAPPTTAVFRVELVY